MGECLLGKPTQRQIYLIFLPREPIYLGALTCLNKHVYLDQKTKTKKLAYQCLSLQKRDFIVKNKIIFAITNSFHPLSLASFSFQRCMYCIQMIKRWISCVLFSQGGHCRSGIALNKHPYTKKHKGFGMRGIQEPPHPRPLYLQEGTEELLLMVSVSSIPPPELAGICFKPVVRLVLDYGWLGSVGVQWFSIKTSFATRKKQIYTGQKQVITVLQVMDKDCMWPFPAFSTAYWWQTIITSCLQNTDYTAERTACTSIFKS